MIIPMLCVTIFVILVVWFLLPRDRKSGSAGMPRPTFFPYTTLFRSRLLEASTMKSRRGFAIQRLMNAMRQAHADGWFIVFDTLTLADDRLEAFYDNPNALRDYFRDIGRMVLAAEGRKANDSH